MSGPAQELARLSSRLRLWAERQAAAHPGARVRLAQPLAPAPPARPAAGARWQGGPRPQPPWAGSLSELREQFSECQLCPLGGKRKKLVFGEGPLDAPLAFVAEAPGGEEDATGRPFAGPAGQMLDRILAAMGFKRSQIYLATLVKCRPAGASPSPAELEACRPLLERQLALLKPRVLVALGPFTAAALLGPPAPGRPWRGRWASWQGLRLMPSLHPAELLKDPGLKRQAWDDMKQVMQALSAPDSL